MTAQALRHDPESLEELPARTRGAVCFITQNFSFGGMEVHTLGLMRAMIDRGYRIELIANRYDRYDEVVRANGWDACVRIIHTDLNGILYGERSDRRKWRQLLKSVSGEILVFPKGNYNYGHLGFLRECRRAFKKIVFIEHRPAYERPKSSSRRWLGLFPGVGLWWLRRRRYSRMGSRYADTIVAVSEEVRERLVTDLGYAPGRVIVVQNGVPWRMFDRREERARAFRIRYGIPSDVFVFGVLSRLSREKGIDDAIRALNVLAHQGGEKPFCLVIAGEGSETETLKQLATGLGLQDRVRFIGFIAQPEEVLAGFDVILLPSRVEGLPLGLLQGMSAGCIPIVTRVGGMPEAVNSPDVGWVVNPDDPQHLSEAMNQVLVLEELALSKMRQHARRRVQEHFDVDKSNRRLLEICES